MTIEDATMGLKCSYVGCDRKADGILAINTQGGFTVPMPMDQRHADYRGKLVSITYLETRDPQFQVEYLPADSEASLAKVLAETHATLTENQDVKRGLWRRLWAQEKSRHEHTYDIMADVLFGLGVPLKVQSPLQLPRALRDRLARLWADYMPDNQGSSHYEEVQMMLDGTVQWIPDESAT